MIELKKKDQVHYLRDLKLILWINLTQYQGRSPYNLCPKLQEQINNLEEEEIEVLVHHFESPGETDPQLLIPFNDFLSRPYKPFGFNDPQLTKLKTKSWHFKDLIPSSWKLWGQLQRRGIVWDRFDLDQSTAKALLLLTQIETRLGRIPDREFFLIQLTQENIPKQPTSWSSLLKIIKNGYCILTIKRSLIAKFLELASICYRKEPLILDRLVSLTRDFLITRKIEAVFYLLLQPHLPCASIITETITKELLNWEKDH